MATGWLVNDHLNIIPGAATFWEHLLTWLPDLEDRTGHHYDVLADTIEAQALRDGYPTYVIRNGTYFRPMRLLQTKQITLIQDIAFDSGRAWQVEASRTAAMTVFNSGFTRDQYPELTQARQCVIPLGVDFDRFRPLHAQAALRRKYNLPLEGPIVCFIGATWGIKGFAHLCQLVNATPYQYVLVLKDTETNVLTSSRVRVFYRVPHAELVEIINACDVGVCTSIRETQHLAGLEMGGCDVPMVAPEIGIYYDQPADAAWGRHGEIREFPDLLANVLATPRAPRRYWEQAGVTLEACRQAWQALHARLVLA